MKMYKEDSGLDSSVLTHKPSSSLHSQRAKQHTSLISRASRTPSPLKEEDQIRIQRETSPSRQSHSSTSRTVSKPSRSHTKHKRLSPSPEASAVIYERGGASLSPDLEKSNMLGKLEKIPQQFLTPLPNQTGGHPYYTIAQLRALERDSAVHIQKCMRGYVVRKYWKKVLQHREKKVPFDIRLLHNPLLRPFDRAIQKIRK